VVFYELSARWSVTSMLLSSVGLTAVSRVYAQVAEPFAEQAIIEAFSPAGNVTAGRVDLSKTPAGLRPSTPSLIFLWAVSGSGLGNGFNY